MGEVEEFAKDRRRYRIHAVTACVALPGLPLCTWLPRVLDVKAVVWIAFGFAVLLTVSGAFAISVQRTIFSKRADETRGLELDGDHGDAVYSPGLRTLNLWPWFSNAVAPHAMFAVGLVFSALLLLWSREL